MMRHRNGTKQERSIGTEAFTLGAMANLAPLSMGTAGAFLTAAAAAAGAAAFFAISSLREFIISCILPRMRGRAQTEGASSDDGASV